MSLLLEALKKAERDKLGEKKQTSQFQDNVIIEDTTTAFDSKYTSGEALELVPDKTSSSNEEPKKQIDHTLTQNRIAAQNIFSAKQNRISSIRIGHAGKWIIFSGIVLVIMMSGAYYVWQEITSTSGITARSNEIKFDPVRQMRREAQLSPQARKKDLTESKIAIASVAQAPISSDSEEGAKISAPLIKKKDVSDTDTIDTASHLSPVKLEQSSLLSPNNKPDSIKGKTDTDSSSSRDPINIQHNPVLNEVSPQLTAAYQAYVAGDLDIAKQRYLKLFENDESNQDVLLGLAAIATRMHQDYEAQSYYLRILELDPRDPSAIAGMAALRKVADPNQTESRMKTLLAQQPDAAALHFTLGNNYVTQLRWAEAQQSFFRAFSIDSSNADYAFNLAVSLDHLNKTKLAAKYYSKALMLATDLPVGFNKAQAAERIKELAQ